MSGDQRKYAKPKLRCLVSQLCGFSICCILQTLVYSVCADRVWFLLRASWSSRTASRISLRPSAGMKRRRRLPGQGNVTSGSLAMSVNNGGAICRSSPGPLTRGFLLRIDCQAFHDLDLDLNGKAGSPVSFRGTKGWVKQRWDDGSRASVTLDF